MQVERGRVGHRWRFNGSDETCQLEGKIVPIKEIDQDDLINWLADQCCLSFY